MAGKRLLWQIYPSYLLITLAAIFAVTWFASNSFKNFYLDEAAADLEARALLAAGRIVPDIDGKSAGASAGSVMDETCRKLGESTATRFTVILPDGKVIFDSDEDPLRMDNHADRPEIREAMRGRTGVSSRYSYTLRKEMMYTAVPWPTPALSRKESSPVAAVVRAAIPVTAINTVLGAIYFKMVIGGVAAALVAALVGLYVSRRITRPMEEMKESAERFAGGELDHRMAVPDSAEIGGLAEAMNQMAARLDERMRAVVEERNEREAILASMTEGVLAVDNDDRFISINSAAAAMLGIDFETVKGRTIQKTVRNTGFLNFVSHAQQSAVPVEDNFVLSDGADRYIQACATALHNSQNTRIGVLLVLNDVTRLRKLENVRRDFVANVSHELKTPITSIKGFVETLLDGAKDNAADLNRFLEIVAHHTDRLNAIIVDLLSLSRIEQEGEEGAISLEESSVHDMLLDAVQDYETKAAAAGVEITVECEPGLRALMNAPLLEQAVINLIDNAVKYSEKGSRVRVEAAREKSDVVIAVRDEGCGIAEEHLDRLFERFYRVDKARSRKQGGTGLGLAIVKHIVLAHSGRVSAESTPGEGSVFFIRLEGA